MVGSMRSNATTARVPVELVARQCATRDAVLLNGRVGTTRSLSSTVHDDTTLFPSPLPLVEMSTNSASIVYDEDDVRVVGERTVPDRDTISPDGRIATRIPSNLRCVTYVKEGFHLVGGCRASNMNGYGTTMDDGLDVRSRSRCLHDRLEGCLCWKTHDGHEQ